jgi:structural maintenance of chromosome 2
LSSTKSVFNVLQENSGTRYFEGKKDIARRVLRRKEGRIYQIDCILEGSVYPTLVLFQGVRLLFLRWIRMRRDIAFLSRILLMYECVANFRIQCGVSGGITRFRSLHWGGSGIVSRTLFDQGWFV